ncbi:MAG TPA: efflux RND transporter periplasmic adaptor subunit [Caulobacteraceae bacterium]|nr:efflux RND transporter periplasmic adaptor subunit [Caulobacteraceae bacterium]
MSHFPPVRPRALARRTQILLVLGAGAALALALLVVHLFNHKPEPKPQASPPAGEFHATAEERANIVLAAVMTRTFTPEVVTDGKLATDDDHTTQVFPPFTGRVTHVYVSAGQAVRAGQPLASIAANEVIQAQSDLAAAQGAERQAAAQATQARAAYERQGALYKADAASQRDLDQARTDLAAAEQALTNAHAAAAAAAGRVSVLNLAPQLPNLSHRAATGHFLREGQLVAPIAGLVIQRQVGEGQFVNSVQGGASQPLMTISDTHRLWLTANLRDTDAQAIRVGAPVRARIEALGGRLVTGRVSYVAPAVDPAARRVIVRAEIPNPDGLLRPEMFAEVAVGTGPAHSALAAPQAAIIYDGPKARVWVARPTGDFALREVELGVAEDGFVEVRSGLGPNDRVATAGALFLDEAGKGDQ